MTNSRAQAAIALVVMVPLMAALTYWACWLRNWDAVLILVAFGVGICAYFGFQVTIQYNQSKLSRK